MSKNRSTLAERVTHWFTFHPWLKVISLILAILAWFYVSQEISNFK